MIAEVMNNNFKTVLVANPRSGEILFLNRFNTGTAVLLLKQMKLKTSQKLHHKTYADSCLCFYHTFCDMITLCVFKNPLFSPVLVILEE